MKHEPPEICRIDDMTKHHRTVLYSACAIIIVTVLILISLLNSKESDKIQVGIRYGADGVYDDTGMNFVWEVENRSDHDVHFKENNLASITINGESYNVDMESVVLEPGEEYSVNIRIPYPIARIEGSNTIEIVAISENGTEATCRKIFRH